MLSIVRPYRILLITIIPFQRTACWYQLPQRVCRAERPSAASNSTE